ncbi:unnamed protein product, partial [marine sediment metagenome]
MHTHPFTGDTHEHTTPGGTDMAGGFGNEDDIDWNPATGITDNGNVLP